MKLIRLLALIIALFAFARSLALAKPPEGLEYLVGNDGTAVELVNFKAKLIPESLRSLYENVSALKQAAKGPKGKVGILTFEWRNDIAGGTNALAAIEAARSGAEVIVIIDAVDIRTPERERLVAAMYREGVKVFLFRPIKNALWKAWERLHEKGTWVRLPDGRVIFLSGGRNKSDHYLIGTDVFDVDSKITVDAATGEKLWRAQFETLLRSKAVVPYEGMKGYDETTHFLQMHKMQEAYELAQYFFATEMPKTPDYPEVDVDWGVFLRNRGGRASVTRAMEAMIAHTKERLLIANAYFLPSLRQLELLGGLLDRDVVIDAYSNSIGAVPHRGVSRFFHLGVVHVMEDLVKPLVVGGMNLNLKTDGELHAKTLTSDGRVIGVTSCNMDGRSETHDTQNGIFMDSPALAGHFSQSVAAKTAAGDFKKVGPKELGFQPYKFCMQLLMGRIKGKL